MTEDEIKVMIADRARVPDLEAEVLRLRAVLADIFAQIEDDPYTTPDTYKARDALEGG